MEPIKLESASFTLAQLGYVYKDIQKQAELLESLFKIKRFGFYENKSQNSKYRGKSTSLHVKIGLSRLFNVQIELIELIEGDCIYKEFLESEREGLHHFGIFLDDITPIKEELLNKGYEIVHEGGTSLYNVVYFDTVKELGVFLEFQESTKRRRKEKKNIW
ncbi:MAG: VOC family protein [Candidatus Thorarchaeota archaeon]